MSDGLAAVSKFLTWSVVDGPGNRFVLFLQGCNYRCVTCHNPHTIGICRDCGTCVTVCPSGALSRTGRKVAHDPGICISCDSCLAACPTRANPMVKRMTVEDVLGLLRRNAPFLQRPHRVRRRGNASSRFPDRPVHGHQGGAGSCASDAVHRQQWPPAGRRLAARCCR